MSKKRETYDGAQRPFTIIDNELIGALTPMEINVYLHIKRRAGGHGECWESLAHMADETGASVSSLKKSIKSLVRQRLIVKQRRPGETDLYTLTPHCQWMLEKSLKNCQPNIGEFELGGGLNLPTEHRLNSPTNKIPFKIDPIKTQERSQASAIQHPEPGQNLTPFAEHLAPAVCPDKLLLTADSNDRFLGFRVEPGTANNQQPPETINPSGSNLVDSNSAESIVSPEPTPIPPPPSLPTGGKFGALLDRFKAAKKPSAPSPVEVDRSRLKALADVQSERYGGEMEDPDGGLPGVGKSAQEGTLELFVVSLADELDKGTLLELIGEVNEPLPGLAPRLLVERLWDTYRQWRPNCWQAPAALEKSRSITTDVANLWRQMANPKKSTAENMADIELRFRATLFYFHCHPWYSGQEFKSKHLGYLLRCKRGETATIDKYADCWETTPAADKVAAQQTINKLLQAREHAINS